MRRTFGLLPLLLMVAACAVGPAPRHLAGVPLVDVVSGAEAQKRVLALHGPGATVPQGTLIARYAAPGRELLLYRSTFVSDTVAAEALTAMLDAIERKRTPFTLRNRGPRGATLSGLGREHAVWVDGPDLLWLEATPGELDRALADLDAGENLPGG